MVTMRATILAVQKGDLLVRDHQSEQEVIVHTANACCFCPGEQVCIQFDGAMTLSIPPQISARCVCRISCSR